MKFLAAVAAVILFAFPARVLAQAPATFRVGLQSIAIPAPPGDNLVETGSDYRVLLEPLATTSNRLVAAFVLPEELTALQTAKTKLTRFSLVEVSRRLEFSDVSPEAFLQFSNATAQQMGATMDDVVKDQQDEISRKLKAMGDSSTTVNFDKPAVLGVFFSKTNAVGFGMILPLKVNETVIKAAAACTLIRLHNRVLFLYTYTPYTGEDSVKWVSKSAEKWSDVLLSANKE